MPAVNISRSSERLNVCPFQVWRYQPWVQDPLDKLVAEMEQAEKPTIGFHIRGGDKLREDQNGCAPSFGSFPSRKLRCGKAQFCLSIWLSSVHMRLPVVWAGPRSA